MTEPEKAPSSRTRQKRPSPRWQLRIEPDGTLTAETTGFSPPFTVTGDTLASLRKQTRDVRTSPGQS